MFTARYGLRSYITHIKGVLKKRPNFCYKDFILQQTPLYVIKLKNERSYVSIHHIRHYSVQSDKFTFCSRRVAKLLYTFFKRRRFLHVLTASSALIYKPHNIGELK
jgi:hypothetical protein